MAEATTETTEQPPKKRNSKWKPGPGRPKNEDAQASKDRKQNSFFAACDQIVEADWGTRAIVWTYRLEPFTDRRRSGEAVYQMQYAHPVDENRIMADFGSGRYRLMLTFRKSGGADRGDLLAQYEFEINNQQHPPKIPAGEWIDDSRNKKWEWAKPFLQPVPIVNGAVTQTATQQPAQQSPQNSVLETLQVLTEVQRAADERADSKKTEQPDPIEAAVKIIQLTKGGGETVLMQMFANQLERAQARAEKLEDELRSMRAPVPTQAQTSPLEQMKGLGEMVKTLKELGLVPDAESGPVGRSRMTGWMELVQPWVTELLGVAKTVAPVIIQSAAMRNMQPPAPRAQPSVQIPQALPPQQPVTPPQSPAPQTAQPDAAPQQNAGSIADFVLQITPRMLKHFDDGLAGGDFAAWLADGYSVEIVQQIQTTATVDQIVLFYKSTPFWEQLAYKQEAFHGFLTQFMTWKPGEEDDEGDDAIPSIDDGDDDKEEGLGI